MKTLALLAMLVVPGALAAQGPVAARDLARGVVLGTDDIAFTGTRPANASGNERVGWVTRRVIAAGEALRQPAVAPPELVRSGETVDVVWSDGSIEVRARGQATRSGGMGDRISVRIDQRRRLEGMVAGPGLVHLNFSDRGKQLR